MTVYRAYVQIGISSGVLLDSSCAVALRSKPSAFEEQYFRCQNQSMSSRQAATDRRSVQALRDGQIRIDEVSR